MGRDGRAVGGVQSYSFTVLQFYCGTAIQSHSRKKTATIHPAPENSLQLMGSGGGEASRRGADLCALRVKSAVRGWDNDA